jgi:hypothetical protein
MATTNKSLSPKDKTAMAPMPYSVAMHVALDASGSDLLRTVVAFGMSKQCRDQQWLLHH